MLPKHLNDRQRFNLWSDIHNADIAALDYSIADATPFKARIDLLPLGKVILGETSGTINRVDRTKANIARDGGSGHSLFMNTGEAKLGGTHLGREFTLLPGDAVMISNVDAISLYGGAQNSWLCVVLPDGSLRAGPNEMASRLSQPIGGDSEPLGLLRRYCRFLDTPTTLTSPSLLAHAADTIIDLIGLAAANEGQKFEFVDAPGVRAARLAAIINKIQTQFDSPAASAQTIAQQLGLSARYVHQLLQESGIGFGERILELRLQKSRAMLADHRHSHVRISDIALAAGFGDVSYFNRCFRRRFGCTPGTAR